jgi:hypothetical protein
VNQAIPPNAWRAKQIEGLISGQLLRTVFPWSKFILILAVVANLSACRESGQQQGSRTDDRQIVQAQQERLIKSEVTGRAPVKELLPDDLEGLKHEKFLLRLSNGTTVLVAHDISYAPRVPLQEGDFIVIHGEYIWNPKGGLIHWTHRSDTPRHEGGWIDFKGTRYQ